MFRDARAQEAKVGRDARVQKFPREIAQHPVVDFRGRARVVHLLIETDPPLSLITPALAPLALVVRGNGLFAKDPLEMEAFRGEAGAEGERDALADVGAVPQLRQHEP